MAFLGKLDRVMNRVDKQKFEVAFAYLWRVIDFKSYEHQRLLHYVKEMWLSSSPMMHICMPCIQNNHVKRVIKTGVKVRV